MFGSWVMPFCVKSSVHSKLWKLKQWWTKNPKPFLYEYYNVVAEYPSTSNSLRSVIGKIFNCLVNALNENVRLPKYILICPDRDIIEYAKQNEFGASLMFEDLLDWLCRNFETVLDTRREDIRSKRHGALWSYAEPRLVWIQMIPRPFIDDPAKKFVFAQCKKFNETMEDIVLKFKHSHVMSISFPEDSSNLFDRMGFLSSSGKVAFWREVDKQMKAFDKSETDLRPGKRDKTRDRSRSHSAGHHRTSQLPTSRLPKPPQRSSKNSDRYHYYSSTY